MQHHLLVPLDGSPSAEQALPHAIALAQRSNATIHVVRVLPPQQEGVLFRPEPAAIDDAKRYLDRILKQIKQQNVSVEAGWRCGEPVEQILCDAIMLDIDVIIMATQHYTGLERLLLGSVAERVVRMAECPVMLVHGNTPVHPCQRLLVALDRTPTGEAILPYAEQLSRMLGASLVLFHVIAKHDEHTYAGVSQDATQYLEAIAARLRADGLEVEVIVSSGEPGKAIVRYAQARRVDGIAMTTHSKPLLERTLFGSVAAHVLTHADLPIMFYHYHEQPAEPGQSASTSRYMAVQST